MQELPQRRIEARTKSDRLLYRAHCIGAAGEIVPRGGLGRHRHARGVLPMRACGIGCCFVRIDAEHDQ